MPPIILCNNFVFWIFIVWLRIFMYTTQLWKLELFYPAAFYNPHVLYFLANYLDSALCISALSNFS